MKISHLLSLFFISFLYSSDKFLSIDENKNVKVPALGQKEIEEILKTGSASKKRLNYFKNILLNHHETHGKFIKQIDHEIPTILTILVNLKKQDSTHTDVQQAFASIYPTCSIRSCSGPNCPFTNLETKSTYYDQCVAKLKELYKKSNSTSIHFVDFASGRLEATSIIALKFLNYLNETYSKIKPEVTIHCIDTWYSTTVSGEMAAIISTKTQFEKLINKSKDNVKVNFLYHKDTKEFASSFPKTNERNVLFTGIDFNVNFPDIENNADKDCLNLLEEYPNANFLFGLNKRFLENAPIIASNKDEIRETILEQRISFTTKINDMASSKVLENLNN